MKTKINDKNSAAIEAALTKANGKAFAHTFVNAEEIIQASMQAEAQLEKLALAKGSRSGATATANSGGSVANAYKYTRITTTAQMVRGSSAWFLTEVSAGETFRKTAGETFVSLTSAQDAEVSAKFRSQYGKQPVATVGGAS